MSFASRVLSFYKKLLIKETLPPGVEVLNPYQDKKLFSLCSTFYNKYYDDENERFIIIGINPGRYGGGITGIPFTDPVKLEKLCGIPNDLPKKVELSADYIYQMIHAFGSIERFYKRFYFNSVSPLGFTYENKNLNYYDRKDLISALDPFITKCLKHQATMGVNRTKAFCLGEGENYRYLNTWNEREQIFQNIIPLAHPRFIMQYKRKFVNQYIDDYLQKLTS